MSENQQQVEQDAEEVNTDTSGGYQTPIDPSLRQTGTNVKTTAKESAKPEAGGSVLPGSPNQGTESR